MLNKINTQKIKIIIGSFLLLGILSGAFGASPVFAEAKQSTLTLSASTNSLSVELTPDAVGTFGKSNSATISVRTDNFTGYTLGVFTDGMTDLIGDVGGTIKSITGAVTEQAFSTDSSYNNKWGYRPSKIVSANGGVQTVGENTSFLPVPGVIGDTIDITNAANSTDNTYTLDFGVRVDYDTIPGTYNNSLTIVALANEIIYNINYDKNTTDEVNDMPSPNPQVVTIDGGTPVAGSVASLSDALPTRNGYHFEGWCDVATSVDPTTGNQVCSGNIYVAGADYGIDQTEDGSNIRLYAVWSVATTPSMQDITTADLEEMMPDEGDSTTIIDDRNDSEYGIARINDMFWMTTDLNIGGDSAVTLTSDDTNLNDGLTSYTLPASSSQDFEDSMDESVYVASEDDCNNSQPCRGYYSYGAVTAGTNPNTGSASSDICPKGWRLPTTSEFSDLVSSYGSDITNEPFYGSLAGLFDATGFENGGVFGGYWSSDVLENTSAISLQFAQSQPASVINWDKTNGLSARCVKKMDTVSYNISLNRNCTTTATGSTQTTVSYLGTTLGEIETPTCSGGTNTRTVSNFNTAHNYSDGATVTFQSSGNCTAANNCSSSNTTTNTFNGWHVGSGDGALVASTATTPVLQQGVEGYTDFLGRWTRRADSTLHAGWTVSATPFAQITLPTITKDGYTCKWQNVNNTSIFYDSGASIVPGGDLAVQGYCVSLTSMQGITTNRLAAMIPNTGDSTILSDGRDGDNYQVTNINGVFWMTDNLSLGGDYPITLTSTDTNLNDGLTSYTLPASDWSGFIDGYRDENYDVEAVLADNGTECSSSQPCYSYYSYAAATAGTNPTSGNATSDICPRGWRLPTNTEFTNLKNNYSNLTAAPFYGSLGGYLLANRQNEGGLAGHYWSSNAGSTVGDSLALEDTLSLLGSKEKYDGLSIRCVKDTSLLSMQEVTSTTLAAMMPNTGDSATLVDDRDGNEYNVAKIDGNYWMTTNLSLGDNSRAMTLTNEDTNLNGSLTSYSLENGMHNAGNHPCSNNEPCYGYYNYYAATAGTNPSSGDAPSDICPKGWRMPTESELRSLIGVYPTGSDLMASPFYAARAGYYYDNTYYSGDSSNGLWSSTAWDNQLAPYLMFSNSGSATVGVMDDKPTLNSVRCLKKPDTTHNLVVEDDNGTFGQVSMSSMSVKVGSPSGPSLNCTWTSGQPYEYTCYNLTPGIRYYLYPTLESGVTFSQWTNVGSYGSLGSPQALNTYFIMGDGDGKIVMFTQ